MTTALVPTVPGLTVDDLGRRKDSLGRRCRWPAASERFGARYREVESPVGMDLPCWQWDTVSAQHGYGNFHDVVPYLAHRWSYEHFIGPVPEGLVLDHLCRNRGCVNPAHLEPVTNRENVMRGVSPVAQRGVATHCKHGHPFDEINTLWRSIGGRACRACQRVRKQAYDDRKKVAS